MRNYLKNIKLRFYLLATIPLIFFLFSCNFPTDANNVSGIAIVPGVSVNGIKLGATKAQIEAVMGKQNILGFADGKYRSYTMYIYTDSSGFYGPFERYKVSFYFLEYGTDFDTVDVNFCRSFIWRYYRKGYRYRFIIKKCSPSIWFTC